MAPEWHPEQRQRGTAFGYSSVGRATVCPEVGGSSPALTFCVITILYISYV